MKKLNDHFKEILENVGIAIRESSNSQLPRPKGHGLNGDVRRKS
mgnify:CR=1 FL=1